MSLVGRMSRGWWARRGGEEGEESPGGGRSVLEQAMLTSLLTDDHVISMASGLSSEIQDLIPVASIAQSKYDMLVKSSLKWGEVTTEDNPAVAVFGAPLTDDEIGRLRYGRRYSTHGRFAVFGDRWQGLSLFYDCCPDPVQHELIRVFDDLQIWRYKSASRFAACLKELSGIFKKYGDHLSPCWKYFVDLGQLGFFQSVLTGDELLAETRSWLGEKKEVGDAEFRQGIYDGLRTFMDDAPVTSTFAANERVITVDEFVNDPGLWAGTGSSNSSGNPSEYRPKLRYHYGRTSRSTGESKWNVAIRTPALQVREMVTGVSREWITFRVFIKREREKARPVVTAPDRIYLKMAYLSLFVERALQGHPSTPLFMSLRQRIEMLRYMSARCFADVWKMPLDQSKFDHYVTLWEVKAAMIAIRDFIVRHASLEWQAELVPVWKALYAELFTGKVNIFVPRNPENEREGGTYVEWVNGMPSGLRWTALFDTMINAATYYAVQKVASRIARAPVLASRVFLMGDDDRFEVETLGHGILVWALYSHYGLQVNPNKTLLSKRFDEFLRALASREEVSGYPARILGSVVSRNPVTREEEAGILRLREQAQSWMLAVNRGLSWDKVYPHMLADLQGGSSLSQEHVIGVLACPAALGGLGLLVGEIEFKEVTWYSFSAGQVERIGYLSGSSAGMDPGRAYWTGVGLDISESVLQAELINNVEINKVKRRKIPGEVKRVERLAPLKMVAYSGGSRSLAARANPLHPITLAEVALRVAIRARSYEWIRDVWLDPSLKGDYDLYLGMGKRIHSDWLEGRLAPGTPLVLGRSPEEVSLIHGDMVKASWSAFCNYVGPRDVNMRLVTRLWLGVELELRHRLLDLPIRLRG